MSVFGALGVDGQLILDQSEILMLLPFRIF